MYRDVFFLHLKSGDILSRLRGDGAEIEAGTPTITLS